MSAKPAATAEVIVIFGPTASGKTGAAVALAEALNGEVVNGDSRQIYAHMPIITAAPSEADKRGIPHHLFEFLDPAERMSAGRWSEMALAAIADIQSRGKQPIIVGGTGMYLRTLMEGISEIPAIPQSTEEQFQGQESEALHKQLQAVDPTLAAKLHPSDTQRITRGLVVHAHTGTPLSAWQAIPAVPPPHTFKKLAINPEREELYARIEKRWSLMEEAGLLAEIRSLKDDGFSLDMPGLQGLGIPEIFDYLDNRISWEEAARTSVQGTRHYAKRQVTWLRNSFGAHAEFASAAELINNVLA